jgi:O-antigen/teichoic acid export membrane protein
MSGSNSIASSVSKFIEHLREPLYRNGYALVLSSATTSGLGMIYWILAARFYTTESVGLNSAVLSMMMFLGGVAQFNLTNVLNRFLPRAGWNTGRLIIYVYLFSSVATLVASLIFILGVGFWSPALSFLAASPFTIAWFTVATIACCIFALQDGALTGLRQATWVPVENTIFAVAKIVLLIIFADLLPQYGVIASWSISVGLALLPVNILIFRRLIPQHARATQDQAAPIVVAKIVKYVSGDYLGYLLWMAMTTLLPVVVVQKVGAEETAYYFLCETIAYSLYLVSRNMGMSLITEAALDQEKLATYSYRVLVGTARMLVPVTVLAMLGAPYILRLFGDNYAAEGTTLLRLLCLSALPNIITSLYTSIARVQQRMTAIVVVQVSLCSLILLITFLLLGRYGITGIGIAWLAGQTIVAVILLFTEFRHLWLPVRAK